MQVSFEDGRPNAYSTQGPRRPNSYHCEPGGAGGLTFQYNPAPAGLITVNFYRFPSSSGPGETRTNFDFNLGRLRASKNVPLFLFSMDGPEQKLCATFDRSSYLLLSFHCSLYQLTTNQKLV